MLKVLGHILQALAMPSNRLQQNSTKTELLWSLSARNQHLIPNATIAVDWENITSIRISAYVNFNVGFSMWTRVVKTVSNCFAISAASVDRSPVLY